ncbi:MAG: diguanylate cyclase [Pseudomonadota bacterium]
MSPRGFWRRLRNLPVGFKLPLTLVAVVALTALAVAYMQGNSGRVYLYSAASSQLARQMQELAHDLPGAPAEPGQWPWLLEQAAQRLQVQSGLRTKIYCFALDPQGRLLATWGGEEPPSPEERRRMAREGSGQLPDPRRGRPSCLVFARHKDQTVLGARVDLEELVGPAVSGFRRDTLWYILGLSLVVGPLAAWLARRELSSPLLRLTREAERVASGDLTPPAPLPGRQDELGRLSRALHSMALAAQEMVEQARASQTRFQQLFTESRDAAFIIDAQGRIEDINPAGLSIFGYPDKESIMALGGTDPLFADQEQRQRYIATLADRGYVQDYPMHMLRRDGSRFEALITATARGQGEARFGLVRDVTQALHDQCALQESEERHRRLLENAPDVIYRWSIPRASYEYLSPALETITGYSVAEVRDDPKIVRRLMLPRFQDSVREQWRALARGEGPLIHEREFQIERRDGQRRWMRERSLLVRDQDGRPQAIEGIVTDVTAHKEVEQALRLGQRMVETVLQGLPVAVMVLNRRHQVVHWNRAMERLTKVPAQEVVGTNRQWHPFYPHPRPIMADLILDHDSPGIQELYGHLGLKQSTMIEGGLECEMRFENLAGRGERHLYFLAAPVLDQDGQIVRAVETLVDFTDKHRLEDELRRLSVTDELTGLYNQRFFFATLDREVESARRYGNTLCLLMLDLDKFKSYNDTYGHLEGDRVLADCARELRRQVRTTDLACRYGGEEFAVLIPRSSLEEALTVAQRVRQGIASLAFLPAGDQGAAQTRRVTVSVGVAALGAQDGPQDLVARADQAMYAAKNQGRDRVAVHPAGGRIKVLP